MREDQLQQFDYISSDLPSLLITCNQFIITYCLQGMIDGSGLYSIDSDTYVKPKGGLFYAIGKQEPMKKSKTAH